MFSIKAFLVILVARNTIEWRQRVLIFNTVFILFFLVCRCFSSIVFLLPFPFLSYRGYRNETKKNVVFWKDVTKKYRHLVEGKGETECSQLFTPQ